jgi:hypothetical protein
METIIAGLSLQEILMLGLGILVVGFIIKKLFKIAIVIGVVLAFVYYGLPILQTMIPK